MLYSIPDILLMFFIYGFIGWCLEVAFFGVTEGKFVNRGFLNGPICPIYGIGGMIVILCLMPLKHNVLLLYIASVIITSALEFVTGMTLEKLYHVRWWDYSDRPFNLKGHICLSFSLAWGIACVVVMYAIHPPVAGLVTRLNNTAEGIILAVLGAVFVADGIITVATLKKLRVRLRMMHEIADKMREISDDIGMHVFEATETAVKKRDEFMESDDVKAFKEKYDLMAKETTLLQRRVLSAFPKMKSRNHSSVVDYIQNFLDNNKKTKKSKKS